MMLAALLGMVGLFVLLALVRAGMIVVGRDAKKAMALGAGAIGLVVMLKSPGFGLIALIAAGLIWAWASRPAPAAVQEHPADAAARALLGVPRGANAAAIQAAHRKKIRAAHPDAGGSATQAAALNAARDRLLARLGQRV
jgi:hypothetical protein